MFLPPHILLLDTDESWAYEKNEDVEDFDISVPMADRSQVHIEHATVDTSKETLGVCKSPVGDSKAALETMQNKADELIARAKEVTLSRRDVLFLLYTQL